MSPKTTNKKEARRRAIQLETRLLDGRYQEMRPPRLLADVIAAYLQVVQTERRAKKTLSKNAKVFERLGALAALRHVRSICDINRPLVGAFRADKVRNGAAANTVENETCVIRQLVNFALSRDMLAADPLKGLRFKKPRPTKKPCWTREQVEQILRDSPDEIRPALTILAETGMRFGEMAWLTWDDIDLAAIVVRIQPKDGWRAKTGDQRTVPCSDLLRQSLQSLPRLGRWVVTMPPTRQRPIPGRQWTERRLLAALKRVLKTLDLPGKLHTFRHAFISNALLQGTSVSIVREWVGHMDEQVIRLYTHVHNEASQANGGNGSASQIGDPSGDHPSAQSQHIPQETCDERSAT